MAASENRHDDAKTPLKVVQTEPDDSNGRGDFFHFDARLRMRMGDRTKPAARLIAAGIAIAGLVKLTLAILARWAQ